MVLLFLSFFLQFLPSAVLAQSAQLHNTAGLAKFYQGRYADAFREFVKALKQDPSYAEPHYNLGRLYEKQQRFEEAISQYQQCLQLDPRHAAAKRAVERLGYYVAPAKEEASPTSVREAREVDLDRQKRAIGQLIVDEKYDVAEERLLLLIRAWPADGSLHNALARVYTKKEDFARAITEYRQAEKYLPSSTVIKYRLASVLYRIGEFVEAERKAKEVVSLDPANYRAYHLLGLIAKSRDDLPTAKKYFAEAAKLNPDDQGAEDALTGLSSNVTLYHYNSGLYYFHQRNWAKAKSELNLAISQGNLNPGQIAIAQQYLLIADFSSQRISAELERIQKDRRRAEKGFVRKRLTFEEVARSPKIWKKDAYVRFRGIFVSLSRDRKTLTCAADTVLTTEFQQRPTVTTAFDYKQDSEMREWYTIKFPKPLPKDPRLIYEAEVTVEGKLQKPKYIRNKYNRLYSREPQPVVKATYLTVVSEDDLSGPLKIDYLAYTEDQASQVKGKSSTGWSKYRYR
jgi:tetratricopeptide (TPR) repeat protein